MNANSSAPLRQTGQELSTNPSFPPLTPEEQQATMVGLNTVAASLEHVSLNQGVSASPSSASQPLQPQQVYVDQGIAHASSVAVPKPSLKRESKKERRHSPNRKAASRDEIVLPSKESGGVPNPSTQYLQGCHIIPQQLQDPQSLLLVIDLNGTLLHRPNRKQPTKFLRRPNAELFLKYCVDTFKVVIWSSAREQNVTAMCNNILTPELRSKVVAIWGRDRFNLTTKDFEARVQCYKRLTSIWQDPLIAVSHPGHRLGRRWDQTNTVLIDDSTEKARSEPHNLVEIPEWSGDVADAALPQVHDYLNYLSLQSNVSGSLRLYPFKTSQRARS